MKYISNYEKFNEFKSHTIRKNGKIAAILPPGEKMSMTAEETEIEAAYDKWCEDKKKFIETEFDKIKSTEPLVYKKNKEDYDDNFLIVSIDDIDFGANYENIFYKPNEYLNNPMFTIGFEYDDANSSDIFYQDHKYGVKADLLKNHPKFGFDMNMSKFLYTIAKGMDPKTLSTEQKLGDNIKLYED